MGGGGGYCELGKNVCRLIFVFEVVGGGRRNPHPSNWREGGEKSFILKKWGSGLTRKIFFLYRGGGKNPLLTREGAPRKIEVTPPFCPTTGRKGSTTKRKNFVFGVTS